MIGASVASARPITQHKCTTFLFKYLPCYGQSRSAPQAFCPPRYSSKPHCLTMPRHDWSSFDKDDKENVPRLRNKSKSKTLNSRMTSILLKRNERERNRVHLLNLGFERLRAVLPKQEGEQLSKISTLKMAIWYIEHLDRVLRERHTDQVVDSGVSDEMGGGLGDDSTITNAAAKPATTRLSPIFPARFDLQETPQKGSCREFNLTSESGYGSSSFATPSNLTTTKEQLEPQPTRMWQLVDFEENEPQMSL